MNKIQDFLSKFYWQLGIDLGSRQSRFLLKEKGIVLSEATAVARLKKKVDGRIKYLFFGQKAFEVINREPVQIEVVLPILRGIVADLQSLEELVVNFLGQIQQTSGKYPKIFKPRVVLAVGSLISEVQRRAYVSVFRQAGVSQVDLVLSPIAGAYGAGFDIEKGGGVIVVDIGYGKTEVSLVSLGGVVVSRGIDIGGDDYDEALVTYLKMRYGFLIGKNSAEKVKIEGGGVARGRDLESSLPKSLRITPDEIFESGALLSNKIVRLVKGVLDEMPTEMSDEVVRRGILMIGGGCKCGNLVKMIEEESKINAIVADEPENVVVLGCGKLINNRKLLDIIKIINR
ncbi:MAG: rod shape-determining protein [Candidatus Shapirobacteria bacterium]